MKQEKKKFDVDKYIDQIWDGLSKHYERLNKKEEEKEKQQELKEKALENLDPGVCPL